MPSIEQAVKAGYAKVFVRQDWQLFKRFAEFDLQRAAFLRTADMLRIARESRLLARNIEKRLLIGIGTELLLKAVYLRHNFSINKPVNRTAAPGFPFTFQQIQGFAQDPDETYMLNDLIQHLAAVPAVAPLGAVEKGLRIAKVFRNKEGHVVVARHTFDPTHYRDIEAALVALYARAFNQTLHVRFSVGRGERSLWRVN